MNSITAYCRIRNYTVLQNGGCLTDGAPQLLQAFVDYAYSTLKLDYPKYFKMDLQSKLGTLAAELIFREAIPKYNENELAIVLSNKHASLDTDIKFLASTKSIPSPSLFVYTLPNIVMGEICIRHNIKGENSFFVFEKFNPYFLVSYVDQLLEEAPAHACLTGWVDVLNEHHDVLLYLVEKRQGIAEHTAEAIMKIYN